MNISSIAARAIDLAGRHPVAVVAASSGLIGLGALTLDEVHPRSENVLNVGFQAAALAGALLITGAALVSRRPSDSEHLVVIGSSVLGSYGAATLARKW